MNHDNGYTARRIGTAVGSLAAAAAACLVLRFAYQGIQIANVGSFVTLLIIVMFAICSALAFGHTWETFKKRPDPDRQASLRGLLAIGFVGSLLAYFFRSLTEAPGEKLHRQEYETAVANHQSARPAAPATHRRSAAPDPKGQTTFGTGATTRRARPLSEPTRTDHPQASHAPPPHTPAISSSFPNRCNFRAPTPPAPRDTEHACPTAHSRPLLDVGQASPVQPRPPPGPHGSRHPSNSAEPHPSPPHLTPT